MSFAEFGASSSAQKKRQVQQQQQQRVATSSPSSGNSGGNTIKLDTISESLLQYQRNVDILSRIVRSISANNILNPNNSELCTQYEAQLDVLGQLEQRVQNQLQQLLKQTTAGPAANPQIVTVATKLKRDFERVQAQSKSLQDAAIPKINAIKDSKNQSLNISKNLSHTAGLDQSPEAVMAEHHRLIQLQMQEDRLAEEIMREREEEIRNINRGMHQVNEIYKDLAHIVGEQQDHIDKIETQMDDARANAEAGLSQVEKANEKYGQSQCALM